MKGALSDFVPTARSGSKTLTTGIPIGPNESCAKAHGISCAGEVTLGNLIGTCRAQRTIPPDPGRPMLVKALRKPTWMWGSTDQFVVWQPLQAEKLLVGKHPSKRHREQRCNTALASDASNRPGGSSAGCRCSSNKVAFLSACPSAGIQPPHRATGQDG